MILPVLGTGNLLLEMARFQQSVVFDNPGQLVHDSHVLRDIARHAPELGVFIYKLLHFLDRLNLRRVLRLPLVLVNILLDAHAQIAKVREDVLLEELVLRRRHHDLFKLGAYARHLRHVNAVVLHRQELVEHGLIRPLVEERRHWVVPPVQQQQHGAGLAPLAAFHRVEKAELLFYPRLQAVRHLPRKLGGGSVPDRREHPQIETSSKEAFDCPFEDAFLIRSPLAVILGEADCRWQIKREEVVIDRVDVREEFLYLVNHLEFVATRQLF
mmetsp:Transcript_110918/g.312691  ORF Transcript_110918/g.312691 Transcript_110918/m.312691 type:complete len:270 (+) Transcript_110918:676-1485(+)